MTLIITPSMDALAIAMKRRAESGLFHGNAPQTLYFRKSIRTHYETGTRLRFTRDVGYHTSGWFKNPDYERCYHLSLSFHDPKTMQDTAYDGQLAGLWVATFYRRWTHYVWDESNEGYRDQVGGLEIHHYRVFCDPKWQPIIPRGEVYTRDFTEKGWRSWSDKRYEETKEQK